MELARPTGCPTLRLFRPRDTRVRILISVFYHIPFWRSRAFTLTRKITENREKEDWSLHLFKNFIYFTVLLKIMIRKLSMKSLLYIGPLNEQQTWRDELLYCRRYDAAQLPAVLLSSTRIPASPSPTPIVVPISNNSRQKGVSFCYIYNFVVSILSVIAVQSIHKKCQEDYRQSVSQKYLLIVSVVIFILESSTPKCSLHGG
jgi:hypothetical protein